MKQRLIYISQPMANIGRRKLLGASIIRHATGPAIVVRQSAHFPHSSFEIIVIIRAKKKSMVDGWQQLQMLTLSWCDIDASCRQNEMSDAGRQELLIRQNAACRPSDMLQRIKIGNMP
ncbi:hypothetical protein V473_20200 [Sphingobium cupriresistens LL01]|uniref:Uncharacterized protein n=1 Tax=Sphingobium cupriresistens LL01 TaxID=1420583 RepID=A0A0J7XN55_9SPHN|nr:hypothetical protein V473_20200 [Sphingobium cupriresistens LL01]